MVQTQALNQLYLVFPHWSWGDFQVLDYLLNNPQKKVSLPHFVEKSWEPDQ